MDAGSCRKSSDFIMTVAADIGVRGAEAGYSASGVERKDWRLCSFWTGQWPLLWNRRTAHTPDGASGRSLQHCYATTHAEKSQCSMCLNPISVTHAVEILVWDPEEFNCMGYLPYWTPQSTPELA
jgi:hypothetical protein